MIGDVRKFDDCGDEFMVTSNSPLLREREVLTLEP